MTRRRLILILLGLAAAGAAIDYMVTRRPALQPDAGVTRTLAQERAARVSDLRYEVTLTIPAVATQPIAGRISASFTLADRSQPLVFDFAQPADHLHAVTANGRTVSPEIVNGHVVIPSGALVEGHNAVQFAFVAGNGPLNRSADYLYTLFVPARASRAMPCLDQPDLKARWTLALDIPAGWTAVSNGADVERRVSADRIAIRFAETAPLPTYLFAFAAGRFAVETAVRNGRTFRMFHRETDAAKVARNRDAIFDLHARALTWLEDYTGIPYAFGKFDFVLIPSFQFGGMEHAGAIYYNASALLLDESATQTQLLGRANVISHETAHMWFGDLVTMRWFDDVWLKEVFANVMAAKIVNPSFPAVNHPLRFLLEHYPSAYSVDRTGGANPIRQDLANLNEAGSLYGAIIYDKAPIVMRQLELTVGPEAFRDGLREYLQRFAFRNATWTDLVNILDARTPVDLLSWSRAWVDEAGRPTIRTELETTNGRIVRLAFGQTDPRGRGLVWPERLQVLVGSTVGVTTIDVALAATLTEVPAAAGLPARWVLPAGGGLGYGLFDVDPATLEILSTSLADITDPLTRGAALVTVWEAMLDGRVAPARVTDELLAALPRETDELLLAQMLADLRTCFWRFTPPGRRAALAPRVDAVLRDGLAMARSPTVKGAWLSGLRAMATTPDAVRWLESLWRHDVAIEGLPLSESDDADLALDLAVRDVPHAEDIVAAQLARFKNPDRKARFAFVLPAVSRDQAVRDAFFETLKDVRNRVHEAWVLDAMRYLNHPLRARASQRYVLPALGLVREIQRTGDIFFPKRWADASLSGCQSPTVASEVRDFIGHLPADYPPRLRWVLLSSADPVFRAAAIVK